MAAINKAYDGTDDKDLHSKNEVPLQENSHVAVQIKPTEAEKKKKEKKEETPKVGIFELFRYADKIDITLIVVGTIFSAVHGAGFPLMLVVFGNMTNTFVMQGTILSDICSTNGTQPIGNYTLNIVSQMKVFAYNYIGLGFAMIVASYFQVAFWNISSERQSFRMRNELMKSMLTHEMAWFDTHNGGELNTKQTADVQKITEGLGNKLGNFIQWTSGSVVGIIIGFFFGWKLTLVVLAASPLLVGTTALKAKVVSSMTDKELGAYGKAGAVAEEVLSSIRTVVSFGGEVKEYERYSENLSVAKRMGIKKSVGIGLSIGIMWLIMFSSHGFGFWYGSKLIREDEYDIGTLIVVLFSIIVAAFSLGNASPGFQAFGEARTAAKGIFEILDYKPVIDNFATSGISTVKGNQIEFRNVQFHYPSRPDVKVLNDFNLTIKKGATVALVGSSGCGKSTTVQLLQRMYDVSDGQIFIDGNDIKDFNVRLLRTSFGVVSQEPVLFSTTIGENIRYGFAQATTEDIQRAAKSANAHAFIMKLPKKYDTLVGERGAQLSGGQKQRIAIARALVKDPKFLLLDEATSALDSESEAVVQDALDKASQGRTTIVIVHRLSTIKSADMIIVMKNGEIVEKGTHNELMVLQGAYYDLVTAQNVSSEKTQQNIYEMESSFERINSSRKSTRLKKTISINSQKSDKSGNAEEEENVPPASMIRVMKMNAPEWYFIVLGCLGAICRGSLNPFFAVIFSKIIAVFTLPFEQQESKINLYVVLFVVMGAVACVGEFTQISMFGVSGENLTLRLRQRLFQSILRQEMAWFDEENNSTGVLCTRLALDASLVQGASGVRLGAFLRNLTNIGAGIVIGFYFGWKLTLLIFGFGPFIALGGFLEYRLMSGGVGKDNDALEQSGKIAIEAIENIRTVVSLTIEQKILDSYMATLIGPKRKALKMANIIGLAFSFSFPLIYFAYAACFYFGSHLISKCEMDVQGVFMVFTAIVFGAMGLGHASSFVPDYTKAKISSGRLFSLLDRQPAIDTYSPQGQKLNSYNSKVSFKGVKFHYPTRPGVEVLSEISFDVNPSNTLALVGGSGCGKSTCLQLLSIFYRPTAGEVSLDGHDLSILNIAWLRKQIGIVSQEPVLFDCSIRENIAYGNLMENISMEKIIAAAKMANIHDFIASLPEGYETQAGDKGTQLSGGQKQRIAIARALIRNPKILLLDEATSALDTESEKVVQEALDKAREGRTCIVIAHRLSTIKNANKIVVIKDGKVHESGTHTELLNNQKLYYRLINAQNIL